MLAALVCLTCAPNLSAQDVGGFAVAGVTHDENHQTFPTVGGGVVVEAGRPWLALGAQAETFWRWPYFGGRASVFGQVRVPAKGRLRPFLLAGYGRSDQQSALIGAGVEFRPRTSRLGLRATVEDYLIRVHALPESYTGHQLAVRVGLSFHR